MKKINIFISILLLLGVLSCEEFLEEENLAKQSTETLFTTADGLDQLLNSCYTSLRIFYGKEEGWDFSTVGTDIYDYGQQHNYKDYFQFENSYGSEQARIVVLWVEFYRGVNACNEAIHYLSPELTPFDEAKTAKYMAQARYLRSVYNWLIVETWGEATFRDERVVGVQKGAPKSTVKEAYALILADLDFAVSNLNASDYTSDVDYGRVTKNAALAFRARMNLTYASHLTSGYVTGGNANDYYKKASDDADAIIASGSFSLWDDYNDMWLMENNDKNKENIWQINYSYGSGASMGHPTEEFTDFQVGAAKAYSERDGGHHGHLMFGTQYDTRPGFKRDLENGRPFRRYTPTSYLIDAFNEDLDERYEGTFKTAFMFNDSTSIPRYPLVTAAGDTINTFPGERVASLGDTGIYFTKETFDDADLAIVQYTRSEKLFPTTIFYHLTRNYFVVDYKRMFGDDGMMIEVGIPDPTDGTNDRNLYTQLNKFEDQTRPAATGDGSMRGKRDAFVIRYPEMFLIKAEAQWRLGNAAPAYAALQTLADKRSKSGDGAALLAGYGVNSGADLTMDYFMDERAREFCGEQMRWFDLKRLGPDAHVARMKKYAGNSLARSNFSKKHTLRPIPQIQFDTMTDTTGYSQNPGY